MDEQLTIGELATATGVATSALRYWEELGLLPAPARASGQRRYSASARHLVGRILFLRDAGFTLRELKVFLDGDREWPVVARRKLAELDDRIAHAQAARTAIAHGLNCRYEDLRDCPKFNAIVAAHLDGLSLAEAHARRDQNAR